MPDTFSPYDFLRLAPNELLARYFSERNLLTDLDVSELPETKIVPVLEAIKQLPLEQQDSVELDFRRIFNLSNKRCIQILFDALRHRGLAYPEFEKKRGYYDKALWVFLEYPELFIDAYNLIMPHIPRQHWKKFIYTPQQPDLSEAAKKKLSVAISGHFQKTEGRGHLCKVEHHQYLGMECLFAYPSDYTQEIISWHQHDFKRDIQRLAFHVIFVFARDGSSVDICLAEPLGTVREIHKIWAESILGITVDPSAEKPSFALEPLHTEHHNIEIPAGSPITRIVVHKLKFVPTANRRVTITIEAADTDSNAFAVYQQIKAMGLSVDYIKQVGLDVYVQAENGSGTIKRRFDISPRSCGLGHEGNDAIIRRFLKQTGIEASQ